MPRLRAGRRIEALTLHACSWHIEVTMSCAAGARVAVGYLRVAHDESAQDETRQRTAIEAWATRYEVDVASWQLDVGVSGVMPIAERPGLVAAYNALRSHGAGVLVAASAERFSQDALVAWLIERAALEEGATLRTADGSASVAPEALEPPALAEGTWTRGAVDLARAYQRVVIRARTRAALAAKKSRGERVGALPYGYRLAADGVHLEADAREQAVITMVLAFARAGLSQRAIVASLAERGVVGRTGSPLQQTQVARLLRTAA